MKILKYYNIYSVLWDEYMVVHKPRKRKLEDLLLNKKGQVILSFDPHSISEGTSTFKETPFGTFAICKENGQIKIFPIKMY